MATAEAEFRANDRDGNGILDFWTGDVSGLYAIKGVDGRPIKLIEISVAGADAHSVTDIHLLTKTEPKSGYHYRSLHPPGEKDGRHPARFGICSYPAQYGEGGKYTFIITEMNTIYKKDLGRSGGIQVYPADPVAEGWVEFDYRARPN